jgi:hypothetical protein
VSEDADAKSYTFPIRAELIPGSTADLNNTSAADVHKNVDFTDTVSSPLTPPEVLRNWLTDWFNPLTGAITTVVAIVTGIIGWGLGPGNSIKNRSDSLKKWLNFLSTRLYNKLFDSILYSLFHTLYSKKNQLAVDRVSN